MHALTSKFTQVPIVIFGSIERDGNIPMITFVEFHVNDTIGLCLIYINLYNPTRIGMWAFAGSESSPKMSVSRKDCHPMFACQTTYFPISDDVGL